mgnify:CR=1 FL=1
MKQKIAVSAKKLAMMNDVLMTSFILARADACMSYVEGEWQDPLWYLCV